MYNVISTFFTVNDEVQTAAKLLCGRYIVNRHTPHMSDWPPYHPKHYTPLTVIHHEGRCTEPEVISNAKKIITKGPYSMSNLAVKNVSDLFKSFEGSSPCPYRILIEGAPGIGKTILSKEIALQWANHMILCSKRLLFLLFMRDPQIKDITNIKSLVSYFCDTGALSGKVTDWLVETDGRHLAIILDGYDEVSEDKQNLFINDIIDRKKLTKCGLVITSRPAASSHLHTIVDCRAEVLGFTEEHRQEFIQESLQGELEKIEELKGFLQCNPYLNTLCYIPLNMSILLSLAEDGINTLPKTQTKLFEKFIIMTIVHFLKKDAKVCATSVASFSDVPHPFDQVVTELAQFAFLALQKDQLVFTFAEVKVMCPNFNPSNWYGLGLLQSAQYFKPQDGCDHQSFHFLHFAIQEYLAAYHIASLSQHKVTTLLNNTFWRTRYFNTWIMYVGITGGKTFAFKHFLSGSRFMLPMKTSHISSKILNNKIKCLHLLHCLGEVNHKMLPLIENIFRDGIIDLSHQVLSPNDVNTLALLLLRSPSKTWEKLDISSCNIDNNTCNTFCTVFNSQNVTLQVKSLNISCNNLHWESVHKLCKVLRFWHTKEFTLSVDSLYNSALMKTLDNFSQKIKQHSQAHVVKAVNNGFLLALCLEEQNRVITVYAEENLIKCCQFGNCNLNGNDNYIISKLTEFVKEVTQHRLAHVVFTQIIPDAKSKFSCMSCFQVITLYGTNMHSKGAYLLNSIPTVFCQYNVTSPHKFVADILAAAICHDCQLGVSYLDTLSAESTEVIRNTIGRFTTLKELHISKLNISNKAAGDIATIISHNNLQALYLQSNKLKAAGAIKIASALQVSSSLSEIDISNNSIGCEAADNLATVLSRNLKLRKLYIHRNNFETAGIIRIARALKHTNSLTKLNISNNNVNYEAADDLAALLSCNIKMQKLYLGGNHFGTAGIIKIARALQQTFSLTDFSISNTDTNCEAADDIALVLSKNTNLQKLYLENNKFQTTGAIKIMKALEGVCSLTECDLSRNDISNEAVDYIATVLSRNVKMQKLYLHENNFGTIGSTKIVKALGSRLSLTEFSLSNNDINIEAAQDVSDFLSHNTQLQKIYLHQNNLGAIGGIKISKALQNASSLIELVISGNNITGEAACDISRAVANNPELQKLHINKNSFGTDGMIQIVRALQECYSLADLNISNNDIGEAAADDIAKVLSNSTKLHSFYIKGNNLGTTGSMKIAQALKQISSLIELSMSDNNIGGDAADDIATMLSCNTKLQKIYIHSNIAIGANGIIKIARALQNTIFLKEFDISGNNVENEATNEIAIALENKVNLQKLDLSRNNFETKGIIKVMTALRNIHCLSVLNISNNNICFEAADDIAVVLSCNLTLQKVNVSGNNLETDGIIKIMEGLCNAVNLMELDISSNNVNSEAANGIEVVLHHNAKLERLFLQDNNFQNLGAIKLARAICNSVSLVELDVSNNNIDKEAASDVTALLIHLQNLHL